MRELEVAIRRLPHGVGLPIPSYATEGSAGADVVAAVEREMVLAPGARSAIPTGLAVAVPAGFELQVHNALHEIDRDGKTNTGIDCIACHFVEAVGADGLVDTDHFTVHVEQWAA